MPVTKENFRRAEAALEKAKNDPNADKLKLQRLQMNLNSFYENATDEDLTEPNQELTLGRTFNPAPEQPKPTTPEQRGAVAGYYYNPTVEEFQQNFSNPELRKQLGFQGAYSDNQTRPESVGQQHLRESVPELESAYTSHIGGLDESSPEYKKYSDYAYQQALSKDPSIKRYDDLDVMENPGQKALGAAIKYGPAAALGAEKTIALGAGRRAAAVIAGNIPDSAADIEYDPMGAPIGIYHPEKAEAVMQGVQNLESLSPEANTVGSVGAYALPFAPANVGQRLLEGSLGYATRNPFAKAGIGSLIGSTGSVAEGAAQDFMDNPEMSWDEMGQRAVPRAVGGALGGAGGDIAAQIAGATRRGFTESPRWSGVKTIRDAGGDTNMITGVSAPKAVRQNITEAAKGREFRTGADIAAQKVAPNIKESVEGQISAQRKLADEELETYLNTPEIANQQESMQPVADNILDMFSKGTFEGSVSGDIKHPNISAVKTFRDTLNSIGEIAHLPPGQAALYAQKNNGRMLDERQIKALGLESQPGTIPVYVASKMPARALLEMEKMIDDKLKMAGTEGGINNPIWKGINRSVKSVRDRFGNIPEFNDPGIPFAKADVTPEPTAPIQPHQSIAIESPNPFQPQEWQRLQPPSEYGNPSILQPYQSDIPTSIPQAEAPPSVASSPTSIAPAKNVTPPTGKKSGLEREPSAEDYTNYEHTKPGRNEAWIEMQPEHRAQADEVNWNENIAAQKREANRLQDLYAEMEKETPATMSEQELEKEITNRLYGAKPNQEIASENQQLVEDNIPRHLQKEMQDARDRYYNRKTPKKESYESIGGLEELGDSAVVQESVPGIKNPSVRNETPTKADISPDSLFPGVKDQVGQPNKTQLALEHQTPDVGKVKEIVAKTDEAASKLSPEELDAIHSYTSRRGEKVGSKEWDSATAKLTVKSPTAGGVLYHGTRLPKDKIDAILKDKKLSLDKPTSTSYNGDIASAMAYSRAVRGEPVVFKIAEVDDGVSLASRKLGIRGTNNEKEILLNNKNFEVKSAAKDKDGNLVIELKQVFKKKEPFKEILDDGTVVYGLSAMQRKHHKELERLNKLEKNTGANNEDLAHRRVLGFKSGEGHPYSDEALAAEADKLGIRQQLEEVAATREYPGLRARAFFGGGEGPMNSLKDVAGFRLDPVLGAVAGDAVNPFTAPANSAAGRIQQYLFRQGVPFHPLLNARAGTAGARYGNEASDAYQERKKKNQ